MLICPRCGGRNFWRLATGQRRCGRCGLTRKFDRTFWGSAKISPYWKGRLLEYFCLGVPAYRLRHQVPLDLKTVQRWFRILRTAIFTHEMKALKALLAGTGGGAAIAGDGVRFRPDFPSSGPRMALGIYRGNGRVFVIPVAEGEDAAEAGGLRSCGGALVCTSLEVRGGSVVVNGAPGARKARGIPAEIEEFWTFTKQWLRHYRGVPRAYFPLYLKEIEWRYNHRGENLVRLARSLLDRQVAAEDQRKLP